MSENKLTDTELTEIVDKARELVDYYDNDADADFKDLYCSRCVSYSRALLALNDKLAAANAEVVEAREDTKIIDALEGVVTGKRNSAFLKSVFITQELGSDRISVDIKCDGVTTATTLRMALGAALNLDAALSAARKG